MPAIEVCLLDFSKEEFLAGSLSNILLFISNWEAEGVLSLETLNFIRHYLWNCFTWHVKSLLTINTAPKLSYKLQ